MALDNIQERLERSVYRAIQVKLVDNGYWPDETSDDYPDTPTGDTAWTSAVEGIIADKGFAIEPYGHSSSQSKGEKKVPRIVIIPRRFNPGDLGNPSHPVVLTTDENPNVYYEAILPQQSVEFQFDIHIVSNKAAQDRILTAIIFAALGTKKFLPFYDDDTNRFFIEHYNYYDLPDTTVGIEEKVYSYAIKDVFIGGEEITLATVPLINEIKVEVGIPKAIDNFANIYEDGTMVIDLSGFQHLFE